MESLFDIAPVRKSNVLRKGLAYSLVLPKWVMRRYATAGDYSTSPPIIVNSLPKSGTHLLLQVARALPGTRYFGGFIASTPSLTLKQHSPTTVGHKIKSILPGEVVGAHIYHSPEAAGAMRDINALHLFIYRDPRDVLLSEAHYLAEMNPWHRMHKIFAQIPDFKGRLDLAIDGYDELYPSCEKRMAPYVGWLKEPDTLGIKYEDLVGPNRQHELERIVEAIERKGASVTDRSSLVQRLSSSIEPSKSHTFREGGVDKWRSKYDPALLRHVNERLMPILNTLDYRAD